MTEPANLQRAACAGIAVLTYRQATGCDYEDSLGDLLCDLMHWADVARFDFEAALDRARMHYDAKGGQ